MRQAPPQSKRAQQRCRAGLCIGTRRSENQLRQNNILARRKIGQKVMKLVDEAERVAPQPGAPVIIEIRRFLAIDAD